MDKKIQPKPIHYFIRGVVLGLFVRELLPEYHAPTWVKVVGVIYIVVNIIFFIWLIKKPDN